MGVEGHITAILCQQRHDARILSGGHISGNGTGHRPTCTNQIENELKKDEGDDHTGRPGRQYQ